MSKRISLVITDDLDGSDNAQTVSFGLDGVSYEIDLSDENRAKLEQALAPFIDAGRRVQRSGRRRQAGQPRVSPFDRTALRTWAKSAGLNVSERGRISRDVLRQYEASHHLTPVHGGHSVQVGDDLSSRSGFEAGLGGDHPGD
jgi:hypothetical protein